MGNSEENAVEPDELEPAPSDKETTPASLFRTEVLSKRRVRLEGDIVILNHVWIWRSALAVFALFGVALVTLCFLDFPRTATVTGWLTTDRGLVLIQAVRPGVVEDLRVKEGQVVRAGQILVVVQTDDLQPQLGATAESASLSALNKQDSWLSQQIALSAQANGEEVRHTKALIASLESQLAQTDDQIDQQSVVVAGAKKDIEIGRQLAEQGLISLRDARNRESAYATTIKELSSLKERRSELRGQLLEARADQRKLDIDQRVRVASLEGDRAAVDQHAAETEGLQRYALTAPVDGRVTGLVAHLGYAIDSHRPLLAIIPSGSRIEAELFVTSAAVGFLRPNQEVKLTYDAFPYQRFGTHDGKVRNISANALLPSEVDAPLELKEPVYIATVALDRQTVAAYGRNYDLRAGTTLRADIVLERRSVFRWLLEPLFAGQGGT